MGTFPLRDMFGLVYNGKVVEDASFFPNILVGGGLTGVMKYDTNCNSMH